MLPAVDSGEKETIRLEKDSWNVGMCLWEGSNLSERHLYLKNSLPQLLKEESRDLSIHVLSEKETVFLQRSYLEDKTISLRSFQDKLFRSRDELLFSADTKEKRLDQYDDLSQDILSSTKEIQYWESFPPEQVLVQSKMPLSFLENDRSFKAGEAFHFLKSGEQDMLITGQVEGLEDLFYLQIHCYSALKQDPLFSWEGTGREDQLNTLIREAAKEMRFILLGRSWAELTVQAEPAGSLIKLDGMTIGTGQAEIRTAEPGFRTLTVTENGYLTDSRQVYLPAMADTDLSVTLEKGLDHFIYFLSDPPGADVFFGSQWQGRTPLYTSAPLFSNNIKVALEGYKSFNIPSKDVEGNTITVDLSEKAYDKQNAFDQAKKDFYKSLGWLSISMGFPLIMYGIYQNQLSLYYDYAYDWYGSGSDESYKKASYYQTSTNITYYCFAGGIAVSGGLLINTLFKLRNYIRAAVESTED